MASKEKVDKYSEVRWGLSDEDVDERITWHSLIELGALQDRQER